MSLDAPKDGYELAGPCQRSGQAPARGPDGRAALGALAFAADATGPALCGWLLDALALGDPRSLPLAPIALAAGLTLAVAGAAAGTVNRPALLRPPFSILLGLWSLSLLLAIAPVATTGPGGIGPMQLVLLFVLGSTAVMGARELLVAGFLAALKAGWLSRRSCLVVAREIPDAQALARALRDEPDLGPVLAATPDGLPEVGDAQTDIVLVLARDFRREELAALRRVLRDAGLVAGFLGSPEMPGLQRARDAYGSLPVFQSLRGPLGPLERIAKRALDLACAGLALFALMPLAMTIALGLALRGAPVFTWTDGLDFAGRPLRLARFGADANGLLARSGLRDLPVLLAVLGGRLSLAGPPPLARDAGDEAQEAARRALRLGLKPGLTSTAVMAPDAIHYCDQWSIALECGILLGAVGHLCIGPSSR